MVKLPFKKGLVGKSSNLVRDDEAMGRVALHPLDVRRMCILRGIYPRVMPKDKNSPWAYFHKKDLTMINSDPMAWYIRDHAEWLKQHERHFHRKEQFGLEAPKAPYDQLIRSRYPSFSDAVKDLDDALNTVALFAQMSGSDIINSERILNCRHLLAEFHYYVSHNHLLTKAFISVRGFYFEAMIDGIPVTWLLPHNFTLAKENENTADPIDYKVLLDFLELYEHLLGFVNARLFIKLGMKYRPEYDQNKWNNGYYIGAIIDSRAKEEDDSEIVQKEEDAAASSALQAALLQTAAESKTEEIEDDSSSGIFSQFAFVLSREVPRDPLAMAIISLGGTVVWDEKTSAVKPTHTVTDRTGGTVALDRVYVQPQFIFDCLNQRKVLDAAPYLPGHPLPPHLSPWEAVAATLPELGEDDREALVGDDDSDAEISKEVRDAAMAADFEEGLKAELAGEETSEDSAARRAAAAKEEIAAKKAKAKEERERLAAGTLPARKSKQYKELKEKEAKRGRGRKKADAEDPDTVQVEADEE